MRKKGSVFLLGLAGFLILTSGLGTANAYFTTYTQAGGGVALSLGSETYVEETVSGWTKRVKITSEEGSQPVYVRARAFCGNEYNLTYQNKEEDGEPAAWIAGQDGYWYYNRNDGILWAGETTPELQIVIESAGQEQAPPETEKAPENGETFRVVVVYETTPVLYDEQGELKDPDWTFAAQTEGGAD